MGTKQSVPNRNGIGFSALKFSDSYAQLPSGTYVGENFTISAWVQISIMQAWIKLIELSNANYADMITVALTDGNGYPSFKFYNGKIDSAVLTGSVKIQTGVWTYIAVTLSNTTGVMYLNNQTIGKIDMLLQNKLIIRTNNNIGKGIASGDPTSSQNIGSLL